MIIKNSVIYGVETKNNATIALQDKSVTENGTYTADQGYDGLGTVTVNVSGGSDVYDTLIFENISGTTNTLIVTGYFKNPSYSLDEGVTWTSLPTNITEWSIENRYDIEFNDKIYFKYNDTSTSTSGFHFKPTGNYNLSGDLYNSHKQNFYSHFFGNNDTLINASGLVFHGDYVAHGAMSYMFQACSHMTVGPTSLPATKVGASGYSYMFTTCSQLLVAPTIAATMVSKGSFNSMFAGCQAMTTPPPILPALIVYNSSYAYMFGSCRALQTAPQLPATTLGETSYSNMFNTCESLSQAPDLPATTVPKGAYRMMFRYCRSLTETPVLHATVLNESVYNSMFDGCTNLNTVITYAQDISATNCLSYWLNQVSPTGNFYNLGNPAPTYPSGASGIPSGWTEHTSL